MLLLNETLAEKSTKSFVKSSIIALWKLPSKILSSLTHSLLKLGSFKTERLEGELKSISSSRFYYLYQF